MLIHIEEYIRILISCKKKKHNISYYLTVLFLSVRHYRRPIAINVFRYSNYPLVTIDFELPSLARTLALSISCRRSPRKVLPRSGECCSGADFVGDTGIRRGDAEEAHQQPQRLRGRQPRAGGLAEPDAHAAVDAGLDAAEGGHPGAGEPQPT